MYADNDSLRQMWLCLSRVGSVSKRLHMTIRATLLLAIGIPLCFACYAIYQAALGVARVWCYLKERFV